MYNKTVWLKLDHITTVWFPPQIWWIRVRYFQNKDFRESKLSSTGKTRGENNV